MDIIKFVTEFFSIVNNALDFTFLWGGLFVILGYPVYFFTEKIKKFDKQSNGWDIAWQTIILILTMMVAGLIWSLPEVINLKWPAILLKWPDLIWFPTALRFGELSLVLLFFAYLYGHEYGEKRWLDSSISHIAIIFLGVIIGRWTGILLVTLPIFLAYYSILYRLALVILPTSDPEDNTEKWKRYVILASYTWGIQLPLIVVNGNDWNKAEIRIPGDFTRDYPVPGLIWTKSHQVAAITSGIKFKRVDGPGVVFTGKLEHLEQIFDLRIQLRTSEIDVISKDGVSFKVRVFTTFRIDPETWDKETYDKLRPMNAILRGADIPNHTKGSFSYSNLRIQAALGVTSTRTITEDYNSIIYWDQWALSVVEDQARKVISQKNLDELWRPSDDKKGANALDKIADEIKKNVYPIFRSAGILVLGSRIVNFRFPSNSIPNYWKAIQSLNSKKEYDYKNLKEEKPKTKIYNKKENRSNYLKEYPESFSPNRDNVKQSSAFPYPEDPNDWQTSYTRDDAHRDSRKFGSGFMFPIILCFLVVLAYTSLYIRSIPFLDGYSPLIRGTLLFVGILVFFLLFAIPLIISSLRFAVRFFTEFYLPPGNLDPANLITYRLLGKTKLPPPLNMLAQFQYINAKNGDIDKKDKWPAWAVRNLGGPMILNVFDGNALYLERGNRFSRVVGPGEKVPFLEWYETIKYVVDLRPKLQEGSFDVWTKDGIKIKLEAIIECRIGDPSKNDPANGIVYPYDPVAVKKAVERSSLRWPQRQEGEPSEFTWIHAAWGQVTGIVPGYIGSRTLDDLLISDRKSGQILSPEAIEDIKTKLNKATQGFGVYVTDFQILRLEKLPVKFTILESLLNEIKVGNSLDAIASIAERLAWIPDELRSEFKTLLFGLEQISAHTRAALESDTQYNKQEQLHRALAITKSTKRGIALMEIAGLAEEWEYVLENFESLINTELQYANSKETIPNVFIPGPPLINTSEVFKGRDDLFFALESELASAAEQLPTLLLFGARRTGKTSVIRQLPEKLGPLIIPTEIDLIRATLAESALGLLSNLGLLIQKACDLRHVDIPHMPQLEQDPYSIFESWLGQVESSLGEHRILLALDEYEKLNEMLADKRLDERFFQLLRVLIQHHPKLILLFSGAHTLEDMPPLWSHYLINVKILKVEGALKEAEARELILKPIPEFNLEYDNDAVERILSATACQPYLLQVICNNLVNQINQAERTHATIDDVENALLSSLESSGGYFSDLFTGYDSDDDQRAILLALASSEPLSQAQLIQETNLPELVLKKALRNLVHRDVLKQNDGNYQFQVELVRRWVQERR
jgi:regulator of protease activity HflC (stomatin/prohibitin superfamily)